MPKVYVIGVGMTKFEKPGKRENFDYPDMARESGQKALKDAGIAYEKVEQAFVGYVYGDSTSGQRAVYELGLTGIPIVNVNNNCSTGATALKLAKNSIETGQVECALALGFEKMQRGSLSSQFNDRANPMEKHVEVMSERYDMDASPMTAQMFGNAGRDYLKKYNFREDEDCFAKIAYKNHKHSVNNPYAQFNKEYSLDEIKNAPTIYAPLTKLQCSPTSDGSAAAILASESFVKKHNLQSKAVEILALEMATDLPTAFNKEADCMRVVGYDMSELAAKRAFQKSGIKPQDIQVVELHDCFSCNELITYEALGLCAPGKAVDMVRNGDNTYGGKYVINPSGGLISKGHPLGATGIAQCAELSWQLRGEADKRQVNNVKYALSHNIGLGGAAVVGVYTLGFPQASQSLSKPSVSDSPSDLKSVTSTHKSGQFFDEVAAKLKEDSSLVSKVKAKVGFVVTLDNNKTISYVLDFQNAPGSVFVNDGSCKTGCNIAISDDNLSQVFDGKLNMMTAFTQKKVKITGNMGIAMKLNQVFASVAAAKKTSSPKPAASTTSTPVKTSSNGSSLTSTTTTHKSGKMFEDIDAKIKQDGANMCAKVNAVIGFKVACSDNRTISYIVDLKNKPGSVSVNDGSVKPGCTILINDDDLLSILAGKLVMMTAFTQKKLKITGNMGIAMKLNQLFSSIVKANAKL